MDATRRERLFSAARARVLPPLRYQDIDGMPPLSGEPDSVCSRRV